MRTSFFSLSAMCFSMMSPQLAKTKRSSLCCTTELHRGTSAARTISLTPSQSASKQIIQVLTFVSWSLFSLWLCVKAAVWGQDHTHTGNTLVQQWVSEVWQQQLPPSAASCLSPWHHPLHQRWWQTWLQPPAGRASRRFYRSSSLLCLSSGTACKDKSTLKHTRPAAPQRLWCAVTAPLLKASNHAHTLHHSPCGGGVSQDVASNRFLRICRKHGSPVHLCYHLVAYHHGNAKLWETQILRLETPWCGPCRLGMRCQSHVRPWMQQN